MDCPCSPELLGITEQFWSDMGLQSRADLPPLDSFHDALIADDEAYASLQQEIAIALDTQGESGQPADSLPAEGDEKESFSDIAEITELIENGSTRDQ